MTVEIGQQAPDFERKDQNGNLVKLSDFQGDKAVALVFYEVGRSEDRDREQPSLLGLYHGIALTERTSDYGGVLPDRITIYREAILDICEDEEDVVNEVAITVVHEIAHHFGIDDERLHELGWG